MTVNELRNGVEGPSDSDATLVPLGTGLPTRAELLTYYPGKFTWTQMKTFVNSGDLGLLKRDKKLQKRYELWAVGIREKYGSMVNYLREYRLQWGKPDTLSLLQSALVDKPESDGQTEALATDSEAPAYFTADTPPKFISIIQNDWPYSVPPEIEHTLIWTKIPIFHSDLVDASIAARVDQDGLWGFSGHDSPPPSPSLLPSCLPALSEWNVTLDKLVRSEKGSEEEEQLVRRAGEEVGRFVKNRWSDKEWETAWFVNPPRLQSVPGLAHIHVFARQKLPEEIAAS